MRIALLSLTALAALTASAGFLALAPAKPAKATSAAFMVQGAINGGQIRFCENQRSDRWQTYHAPADETFFHQEIVLGEGSYSIAMVPNGNFRFDAFVYQGDSKRYVGGARDVRSYLHRFNPGSFGEKYLVQLVKTTNTCRGCSVTMSLSARNCPTRQEPVRRNPCRVNQCYDPGSQDLFGIPGRPPRCVAKPGANGGQCGTRGN